MVRKENKAWLRVVVLVTTGTVTMGVPVKDSPVMLRLITNGGLR